MENIGGKPYKIIDQSNKYQIREFKNYNPKELFWHRDKEDRYVELLKGDVELQFDNLLPYKMVIGEKIFIKKETFHRVIATEDFLIKIYLN